MKLGRLMENKHLMLILLMVASNGVHAHISNENTHYITDSVEIPLRSSNKIQTNPSNLLRMLPSDTKLQLLSTDSGWSQVEIDGITGADGWIISKYLSSTKPARVKLKAREQLIKSLVKQNKKLRVELETMTNKLMTELGVL